MTIIISKHLKSFLRSVKRKLLWYLSLQRGKKGYMEFSDDNKQLFVMSHGIGDIVWSVSFLGAYIKNSNIHNDNIRVICLNRDVNIIKLYYPDFDCMGIDKGRLIDVGRYVSLNNGKIKSKAIIYPPLKKSKQMIEDINCLSDIGMEMDTCYRRGCFQLSEKVVFQKPDLSKLDADANKFIEVNQLIINKTVLLIPYINSRLTLPFAEWNKIAKGLIDKGYDVYTNASSETHACIQGTKPIYASLEILPLVIKKTGYAIAGRCGLADWIYVNECNMSIIHTYKIGENLSKEEVIQSKFGKLESFNEMSRRCGLKHIREYRLIQNSDNSRIISKIIKDVDEEMRGENDEL